MGRSSVYEYFQGTSERILDDRPQKDEDIPPISLLYDGFGHFLDVTGGRSNVPGLHDIKVQELEGAVDDFADKMTMSYRNEDDWRRVGIDALNRIFAARRGTTIPPLHAASIGSAWSSRIIGTHGGGAGVVVFRNSCISLLDSIPQVELLGHVAHLNSNMHQHRALFERWRRPCLGVTVVGATSGRYIISAGSSYH